MLTESNFKVRILQRTNSHQHSHRDMQLPFYFIYCKGVTMGGGGKKTKNPGKKRPSPKRILSGFYCPKIPGLTFGPKDGRTWLLLLGAGKGVEVTGPRVGKPRAHHRVASAHCFCGFKPGLSLLWIRKAFPRQHRCQDWSGPGAGSPAEGHLPSTCPSGMAPT